MKHLTHIVAAILLPFVCSVGACSGFDFTVTGAPGDAGPAVHDATRVAVPREGAMEALHVPDATRESGEAGIDARAGDAATAHAPDADATAAGDGRAPGDGRAEAGAAQ